MTVKEMFDKEFLFESKKDEKKNFKIFYKFDINLLKNKEDSTQSTSSQPEAPVDNNLPPAPENNMAPVDNNLPPAPENNMAPVDNNLPPAPQPVDTSVNFSPSVVTEGDEQEKTEITDDNAIVRKMEGEVILQKEDIDNIQTIEDIINILEEYKQDGVPILDELSSELLQNLLRTNQLQEELKSKIDIKESNVLAEIFYGKKKENSVGCRMIKRKHSDLFTTSMLIDNQIVNSQFNKAKLDSKIVDMRNEEYENE